MIYLTDKALRRIATCRSCNGTGYDLDWPHPPCGCGLLQKRQALRAQLRERQQVQRIREWEQ
jgi:hypothetical protein